MSAMGGGGLARRAAARGRLAHALAVVVSTALLGVAVTSCTTAPTGLGPPESPCFRSLPAASLAVHHRGLFSGVRYLTGHELVEDLRSKTAAPAYWIPNVLMRERDKICAVAYRGTFAPALVSLPWPPTVTSVKLALVVVKQRDSTVLVTILLEKAPLGLTNVFPSLGRTPVLR